MTLKEKVVRFLVENPGSDRIDMLSGIDGITGLDWVELSEALNELLSENFIEERTMFSGSKFFLK